MFQVEKDVGTELLTAVRSVRKKNILGCGAVQSCCFLTCSRLKSKSSIQNLQNYASASRFACCLFGLHYEGEFASPPPPPTVPTSVLSIFYQALPIWLLFLLLSLRHSQHFLIAHSSERFRCSYCKNIKSSLRLSK
jgi:hypothetical protein